MQLSYKCILQCHLLAEETEAQANGTGDAGRRPPPILFTGFPMTWQTDCEFFDRLAKLSRAAPLADDAQCSLWIDHVNPGEQGCPANFKDLR